MPQIRPTRECIANNQWAPYIPIKSLCSNWAIVGSEHAEKKAPGLRAMVHIVAVETSIRRTKVVDANQNPTTKSTAKKALSFGYSLEIP